MYPNGYPYIDDEYHDLYILLFYSGIDNLNEKIKSEIVIWVNSCANASSLDTATTKDNNSAEYYSNIEAGFYKNNAVILSSDVLDEVIDGRKELLESHPNPTLAWLLANNMQTYALNYLHQTYNGESILYFYMQSIKYAEKSLEFEMDSKMKFNRIEYIQSRYKDIADCETIDLDIRDRAREIYDAYQEVLNK